MEEVEMQRQSSSKDDQINETKAQLRRGLTGKRPKSEENQQCSLKVIYKEKVFVVPFKLSDTLEKLIDDLRDETGAERVSVEDLDGIPYDKTGAEMMYIYTPFRVILDDCRTTITEDRDLEVQLEKQWIENEENDKIRDYLEVKLNGGHLEKRKKYLSETVNGFYSDTGNLNDALLAVLKGKFTPQQTLQMVSKLLHMGADPSAKESSEYGIPLHIATRKKNFENVVLELLAWGASVDQIDESSQTALDIAYKDKNDKLAAILIRHMHPQMVRQTFSQTFHNKYSLDEMITGRDEETEARSSKIILSKKDASDKPKKKQGIMKQSVLAVLDSLWEDETETDGTGAMVYYYLLECDKKGHSPDEEGFLENRADRKTCLHLLVHAKNNDDYIQHKVVKSLIGRKWRFYARNYYLFILALYMIASICLTTSLVLALETDNPSIYGNSNADTARITCEAVVVAWIFVTIVQEALEMRAFGLRAYSQEGMNFVDILSVVFLISTIIFRFAKSPIQWPLLSVGYMLSVFRMVRFFSLYRHLKAYTTTIYQTLTDFLSFFILFAVVNFAFSGAFSAALRYNGSLADTNNKRTSHFGHIFFSFAQILVNNEPSIPFYDDNGFIYGFWPTSLLLVSLFVTLVMLMNLLIAQLSDTYQKTREDAQLEVYRNRADIVTRVDLAWTSFRVWFYEEKKALSEKKIRQRNLLGVDRQPTKSEQLLDDIHQKVYEIEKHILKVDKKSYRVSKIE